MNRIIQTGAALASHLTPGAQVALAFVLNAAAWVAVGAFIIALRSL